MCVGVCVCVCVCVSGICVYNNLILKATLNMDHVLKLCNFYCKFIFYNYLSHMISQ